MSSVSIGELCSVVRTKNAGPFLFSIDLVFKTEALFQAVQAANIVTPELVAAMYGVPRERVVAFESNRQLLSFKATLRRTVIAGAPGDSDCFAMAQEAPVLGIRIPTHLLDSSWCEGG